MSRLYVSPIVAEDQVNPDTGQIMPVQYPLVASLPGVTDWRTIISTHTESGHQDRGKARLPWCVCWVEAGDWSSIDAESQVIHLTEADLASPIPRNIERRVEREGIVASGELSGLTVEEAIRLLERKHEPTLSDERSLVEIKKSRG